MDSVISITSQGQMSIPARVREKLGFRAPGAAMISVVNNKLVLEPVTDILELKGILKDRALKGKTIDEIIKIEKKAAREYVKKKYKKG
jgi:AbrB family looped-hinge helix DNA binding protein